MWIVCGVKSEWRRLRQVLPQKLWGEAGRKDGDKGHDGNLFTECTVISNMTLLAIPVEVGRNESPKFSAATVFAEIRHFDHDLCTGLSRIGA